MHSKSQAWQSILPMKVVSSVQHWVIRMVPIRSVGYIEQPTAARPGRMFYISTKIPALHRLLSMQRIQISSMPICGLAGKVHGKMGHGMEKKAACSKVLMEEIHGNS